MFLGCVGGVIGETLPAAFLILSAVILLSEASGMATMPISGHEILQQIWHMKKSFRSLDWYPILMDEPMGPRSSLDLLRSSKNSMLLSSIRICSLLS